MIKNIYSHKNQDVVVWSCGFEPAVGAYNEDKITVNYSYVYKNGRIGRQRCKHIYESQFYDEFRRTNKEVSINVSICRGK